VAVLTAVPLATAHPSPAHVEDSLGAVASESKLCSEIGIELLRRGVCSFCLVLWWLRDDDKGRNSY